jgi:hypothetical protein
MIKAKKIPSELASKRLKALEISYLVFFITYFVVASLKNSSKSIPPELS